MAPVSRRSFLAGLIAAPVIAAVAPATESVYFLAFDDAGSWMFDGYEWRVCVNPRKLGVITNIEAPDWNA
jgi:hypothetical protein